MALVSYRWRRILRNSISTILGCAAIGAVGSMGLSALFNWDPSGDPATLGGTGTWDYTTTTLWDDNGALPNVPWNDVTGVDTAVFKGTGNLVHLGAPIAANGLTFNVTGYTVDNNGTPANTLSLVTAAVAGPPPVITIGANNVSATISANILGNDGLQFTAGSSTGTTTTLSGDNKFIGGVTITSGTVALAANSPGALNQTIANNLSFGTLASTLKLNGNSVTIRDLATTGTLSTITNGSLTPATLTVYQQNDKVVKVVMTDGISGALSLVKAGPAKLTLGADSTYTGATTVRGAPSFLGELELAGNNVGRLTATTAINISDGGTLRLTNTSTNNNGNRLPDVVPLNLRGGTFAFSNDGSTAAFAETAGAVNLLSGTTNLFADQAASGQTSTLTFASLARSQGAVVFFQSNSAGFLTPSQIGVDNRDRIVFTAAPALNDNVIGGWALYDSGNFADFASYSTVAPISVKRTTSTLNQSQDLWATTSNQKVDQPGGITLTDTTPPTGTLIRTVNSLNLASDGISIDLSGFTLNIDTGGLIHQTSGLFGGSIDNGFLTAGTAAGTDLVLTIPNPIGTLTIGSSANIINNGVGAVNAVGLVKAGPGTVILAGANTYTGPTSIVGGTLQIDLDNRLGALTGTPTLKIYDGTLSVTSTMTLNAARTIEVGGNSVISVAAGTTGTGKTLTYNGSITSLAGTEGNLTFLSNASTDSNFADPGKIVASLNAPLSLGGSLRIDATTPAGTATGVFRPNSAFSTSIGRSLQIGVNGTAVFTQTGGTVSVGSGIDDTLDIGVAVPLFVAGSLTFSPVAKVGTLNLTVNGIGAVTQFTAKLDKMRIGVQTQSFESVASNTAGTVVLATANDISAASEITISDNANSSGSTLTASTLTLGSGVNNLTTQAMTIGGRKGTATVTLPAGGTLNLKGFAERTLSLNLGRIDDANSTSGASSTGTLNAGNAGSILTGSFDAIVLGEKTLSTVLGGATGTLTLSSSASNSVVANSLTLGVDTHYNGSANAAATALGTLNFAGGAFTVYNDVVLGTQANNGTARGLLNITGGTFNIGGNITKTNSDRSNGVVTVNGAGAVLNMRNPLVTDLTSGSITASQFVFRLGSVTNLAALTLDGRDVTSGSAFGPLTDALIIRDVSLPGLISLTAAGAN
ncbi:MAG TPA: autotransporter-associated beta strand repeat-containing protein, partial [Chthoniobacteraceae bacterium]|nr:autotransporter-associated beta strand repeat-containing protein [Chthoniobacteraceae bacterium]